MTQITWTGLLLLLLCANAQAQERIYRCGNAYTNTVTEAQAKNCKLVEGANVTVVQGTRPAQQPRHVMPSCSRSTTTASRKNAVMRRVITNAT